MKHSVQNLSISLKRIMIACNARKSIVVFYKSVCDEDCVQLDAWKPVFSIVSWVELGGRGQVGHFMAKRDQRCGDLGRSTSILFYGRGGVRLEIDRCRVIGAGSHLKQPDYHCWRLKRSKSGKRLGFVSPKWLLLITWLGWIHLTWLGEWIWCLPPLLSWDIVLAQAGGNHQFHPQSSSTASFLEQNLGFTRPPSCSIIPAQFFYACHVVVHETSKLW